MKMNEYLEMDELFYLIFCPSLGGERSSTSLIVLLLMVAQNTCCTCEEKLVILFRNIFKLTTDADLNRSDCWFNCTTCATNSELTSDISTQTTPVKLEFKFKSFIIIHIVKVIFLMQKVFYYNFAKKKYENIFDTYDRVYKVWGFRYKKMRIFSTIKKFL